MKRIICIFLSALLLTSCSKVELTQSSVNTENSSPQALSPLPNIESVESSEQPKPEKTHGRFKIIISEELTHNPSVGNEWSVSYYINGEFFTKGEKYITAPLRPTEDVRLDIEITEDDTLPDIGTGELEIILKDGYQCSTEISVTENKGRYYGNTAVWKVECRVVLVDKI